jgi:hypothetical protein
LLQVDVLSSVTRVEFNVGLSELIFNRNREVKLLLFFGVILLFCWGLSCGGFGIGFTFSSGGRFTTLGRGSISLRSESTGGFVVNLLSLVVDLDVTESVNVVLVDLNSLVSEAVPDDESTFLDNVTSFFTLVNIVHELR